MALVDNTKFYLNKENMTQKNIKMGKDLEEKMQTPMESNIQPIKSAVRLIIYLILDWNIYLRIFHKDKPNKKMSKNLKYKLWLFCGYFVRGEIYIINKSVKNEK